MKHVGIPVVDGATIARVTRIAGVARISWVADVAEISEVLIEHHVFVKLTDLLTTQLVDVSAVELADGLALHRVNVPTSHIANSVAALVVNVPRHGKPPRLSIYEGCARRTVPVS